MSEQDGRQATAMQRPSTEDAEARNAYCKEHDQPWSSEPEIDTKRQVYLAERRAIVPDIEQGRYPFKDIEPKLARADVVWLLVTHENGHGPVHWSDEGQRVRQGLDLRGANLKEVDLSGLPLAGLIGGLTLDEWWKATQEQRVMAAMLMEGANLSQAQLEGANLSGAQLENANLSGAQLKKAYLKGARLGSADLSGAQLEDAYLHQAWLENADLIKTKLGGASFCGAHLEGACFSGAQLGNKQRIGPRLADAQWGNANLSVVEWSQFSQLGDEWEAHQKSERDGEKKTVETRLDGYRAALRANRQVAAVLRNQGLNDEADHFAYRAKLLQREVWRRQHRYLKYVGSCLLWLLAGHGYRPLRSILWYLAIVIGFALTYYTFGHLSLWPPDAFVYSLTSFHGRGFFLALKESPLC